MKNLENLNLKLRAQRHDYMNHLQVIYGLLELGEYEDAREYMEPVFKDITRVTRAMKTSQPAVNALLQAKISLFIAMFRKVILLVPLALVLPRFFGVMGIYYAEPISDIISAATAGILFCINIKKILSKEYLARIQ